MEAIFALSEEAEDSREADDVELVKLEGLWDGFFDGYLDGFPDGTSVESVGLLDGCKEGEYV